MTAAARLASMLGARSIAVVGASDRSGSLGHRMATEALRSPSSPRVHLVNPRRATVLDRPCVPSLVDVSEPVDLVLLGVGDDIVVDQLATAAARGDAGAVIFGSATGLAPQVRAAAADMAVCGAGCMGFVNAVTGIRALGYLERDPLPPGPVSFITHSGSAFSAMLRSHRRLGFALAVSSGQELVTTTADYLSYALKSDETRVVGLLLETLRDVPTLRAALADAADRDIPVVALTVGGSPSGRALVNAHSGAIAGDDAAWEALFAVYDVHRVATLDELADTLEAFAIGRRVSATGAPLGIATAHDSGAERALTADIAADIGVPFAQIAESTRHALTARLSTGLVADNPLDVWGDGADTRQLFADCLATLAADPAVGVGALAVDLVPEYDGDLSYPLAIQDALERTTKPMVVLSNSAASVDQSKAGALRALGIPVLEGTGVGLRTLGHLLDHATPRHARLEPVVDEVRREHWRADLRRTASDSVTAFELLADYGLQVAMPLEVGSPAAAVRAAEQLGYPVVLKTGEPKLAHKSDVGGVHVELQDADAVAAAAADLCGRLGPRVLVQPQAEGGVELALGIVRDPHMGPLVLVAAGGTLIEVLSQRSVALPPLDADAAGRMLDRLPAARLLAGIRGREPANRTAVVHALLALSQLAVELGDGIEALDVNPLVVSSTGAIAVDALLVPV